MMHFKHYMSNFPLKACWNTVFCTKLQKTMCLSAKLPVVAEGPGISMNRCY